MSDGTKIEWTDATWNPITGCSVVSPGCTNCYAMRLAGTRMKHTESRIGLTEPSKAGPVWNGKVRFNEQWLDQPLRWRRARRIFVCAHGDLFHESVPDEWIDRVFAVMALARNHTFQVLTKRSDRMRAYLSEDRRLHWADMGLRWMGEDPDPAFDSVHFGPKALPNVWLGVSAEDQQRADERIPDLLATPAAVRFVSAEPLLGPLDLYGGDPDPRLGGVEAGSGLSLEQYWKADGTGPFPGIDWVIVGGESGPGARPMHPVWVRSLRDQCDAAQVPFFLKQWGEWQPAHPLGGLDDAVAGTRWHTFADGASVRLCGKKRAGRTLDGQTWDQMPEAR